MPIFLQSDRSGPDGRAVLRDAHRPRAPKSAAQDQPSEETWNSIKGDIFKDRPVLDGAGLVVLDAPRRAEDAAIVPIGMRVNLGRRRQTHAEIADAGDR